MTQPTYEPAYQPAHAQLPPPPKKRRGWLDVHFTTFSQQHLGDVRSVSTKHSASAGWRCSGG
jgi:hypothetical protein